MVPRLRLALLLALAALRPTFAQDNPVADPVLREPAGDQLYAAYASFYDYDATAPLNVEVLSSTDYGGTKVDKFAFDSVRGQRVNGYLILPPSATPRAVVVSLHGLGGSKEELLQLAPMLAPFGVQYGFLALDAAYHGERKQPGVELFSADLQRAQRGFIQTIVDYRRALDYCVTRPEVDSQRIGLAGMSMGGMMGCILTAVEPRIKTSVLVVAGADWATIARESTIEVAKKIREEAEVEKNVGLLDPVDPLNFAPHLGARPVLLLNGKQDTIIPLASSERLHEVAIAQPLVKEWYDSGHMLPPEQALQRIFGWFQQNL